MKKYQVWGGEIFHRGNQVRGIVATFTKKKAMELFEVSYSEFEGYFCETGNDTELNIALQKTDTVFVASSVLGEDFIEK